MKNKQTFNTPDFLIDIIPYSDKDRVGYIRFQSQKDDSFLGAIDNRVRLNNLVSLRNAIDDVIKQKKGK